MTDHSPGYHGVPDEVVHMTSGHWSVPLRRRVVRIQGNGSYRDILLEERHVYGGVHDKIDRAFWVLLPFCAGAALVLLFLAHTCR